MRNANKSYKIPYFTMAREKWKSDAETVSRIGSPLKVNHF